MKIITKKPVCFVCKDYVPMKYLDEKCEETGVKFFTPIIPYTYKESIKLGKCVLCVIKARFLKTSKLGRKDTLITLPEHTPILTPSFEEFESLDEAVNALGLFNTNEISEDYNISVEFEGVLPDTALFNLIYDLYRQGFYPSITLGNIKSHIKALK